MGARGESAQQAFGGRRALGTVAGARPATGSGSGRCESGAWAKWVSLGADCCARRKATSRAGEQRRARVVLQEQQQQAGRQRAALASKLNWPERDNCRPAAKGAHFPLSTFQLALRLFPIGARTIRAARGSCGLSGASWLSLGLRFALGARLGLVSGSSWPLVLVWPERKRSPREKRKKERRFHALD